ncbi:MAG: ABC transporter ATP-binding protein [Lachnospiraceae bacterium]|nr:ABC transporter ATP-binding protein [Lachnospiraceae bacterium]
MNKKNAFKNNIYALKLVWKMSKPLIITNGIASFLDYFEWLFFSAFFLRILINGLETGQEFSKLLTFIVICIGTLGFISLFHSVRTRKWLPVFKTKVNKELFKILFKKASNVELECFENSDFYDKYTLAMEKSDERLTRTIEVIWGVFFGAIASVCAFIFMYRVDKYSVLFIIFPIIGNFGFNRLQSKIDYNRNKDMAPHNRKISYINRVMYLTQYAKEMRLSDVFTLMREEYRGAIRGVTDVTRKYTKKAMVLHWFYVMFTFTFIFEGLLIYGAYRTLVSYTMTLAQLSVITSLMVSTTWILIGFTDSVTELFKNGLFVDYLKTFLEYKEKIPEDYDGADPDDTIESIEFKNVSFAYKDKEVIKNLNMKFEGGKTYALAGHNGAGKTTIIKLLLRFYDPTEGEVLLNGRNIKEYNLQKYRALFATAFQDHQMFSMSVKDNVLMGHKTEGDATEKVLNALKLAGVYDKVMSLPYKENTILTKEFDDEGAILSGGEFQKVVVARAFVQNSPVKLFDEPSSALDPIAEYTLFDNILKSCKDNTLVFISHRLSSVQNADKIFLLRHGTVREEGSHKELMALDGLYADMYRKQAENYLAGSHETSDGIFKEVAKA